MARKSLRPHLNQIRAWTRQGRTDAWVAHQLDVTVQQIQSFKREYDLAGDDGDSAEMVSGEPGYDEIDLRAEDDALIAAELEAAEERRTREEADAEADAAEETAPSGSRRRRGRRGGRGRRQLASGTRLEGTFDHGEEGYGLWLDPAIAEDPVYAEHWAGHRPVEVTIEEDQIVIRRAGPGEAD
jgi:hypothetical protein